VLDGIERLRSVKTYVAHVTDIEDAYTGPNGEMFFHQATILGVFNRHVPSAEVDHFRAHFAV